MTVRDSEQVRMVSGCESGMRSSSLVIGSSFTEPGRVAAQMPGDLVHERVDGLAAVIAGDVGVDLTPEALDVVVLRAVRRQEVQLEPRAVLGQVRPHPPAGVDAVVVEHQMDIELCRHCGIDFVEKLPKFNRAVAAVTFSNEPASILTLGLRTTT